MKVLPSARPRPARILLGPDHEKRPLYERCAFAVFPQVALAGHQAAAVEAMANGLAIVTSTDGPANSFIDHGVNGYLAASPDEFARYSRMLWEDRDLCRQLGSAARDTIAAESSHERLLIGLSELLR
jgi:glycosyltransferase involved in cell wall biosynthesis